MLYLNFLLFFFFQVVSLDRSFKVASIDQGGQEIRTEMPA